MSTTNHQNINANSGNVEYFTQAPIIEAAHVTMNGIDLDPASCEIANRTVGAKAYFGIADNGMEREWAGRIWLNHPFGRHEPACAADCQKRWKDPKHVCHNYTLYGNNSWVQKLVAEYQAGRIIQSCNITFAATSEAWFQPLMRFPQCYLTPRTNYRLPDGTLKTGVTKGSVVTYMGQEVNRFACAFRELGNVMIPHRYHP